MRKEEMHNNGRNSYVLDHFSKRYHSRAILLTSHSPMFCLSDLIHRFFQFVASIGAGSTVPPLTSSQRCLCLILVTLISLSTTGVFS